MPRLLNMNQIMAKKYTHLPDLPAEIVLCFGALSAPFIAIIWGLSGQGKTNLLMKLMKVLAAYFARILYLSLEEGHEVTIKLAVERHFEDPEQRRKIQIGNHEFTYDELLILLRKKRSPGLIIVDSVQYWNITYEQYKALKQEFPKKTFIFNSHAQGKEPLGACARSIRYDAGIKIYVKGYIAFPVSRYGGNKPYVIWEPGARSSWGKEYRKITQGTPDAKKPRKAAPVAKEPETVTPQTPAEA